MEVEAPPCLAACGYLSAAPPPARHRRRRFWAWLGLAGALALLAGGAASVSWLRHRPAGADLATHTVGYEPLRQSVVARGWLEAAAQCDIVCRVRNAPGSTWATTIRWIIDEGTPVKRGQVLVELDDSGIEEELQARRIERDQAHAAWVQAEANVRMVLSQNEGDLDKARMAVELAALDLAKYEQGDFEQARQDVEGRLLLAEADLEAWLDRAAWAERMARKGYLSASQARAEQAQLEAARLAREKLREERRVLTQYARTRTLTELRGELEQARLDLGKARAQARARAAAADADRLAKQRVYRKRDLRCRELEAELGRCVLTAPRDGLVVYDLSTQNRYGSGAARSVIAQGEPVREGQRLILLPDLSRLVVKVLVHEASVGRLHGDRWERTGFSGAVQAGLLVAPDLGVRLAGVAAFAELGEPLREHDRRLVGRGQPALVRVAGSSERVWHGHVQEVAVLPWQGGSRADEHVYQAAVSIDEPVDGLRPDMTAEVTIPLEADAPPVLTVPRGALVGTPDMGRQRTCYVVTPDGLEERTVQVGLADDERAEVRSGLREGDEVVTDPRGLQAERTVRAADVH